MFGYSISHTASAGACSASASAIVLSCLAVFSQSFALQLPLSKNARPSLMLLVQRPISVAAVE